MFMFSIFWTRIFIGFTVYFIFITYAGIQCGFSMGSGDYNLISHQKTIPSDFSFSVAFFVIFA